MKTVKTKDEKNWALPGVKLTHEEFIAGIKKAEEGPFYSLDEIKALRAQWRNQRKNQ
jgi:hypothetical protein